MILLLLIAVPGPWTSLDEASLGAARDALGFSEGMRALDLGASPAEWRDSAYCGSCHPEAYQEWSASFHASAGSDPLFLAGFADDPDVRCARCHAPLLEDQAPLVRALKTKHSLSPSLSAVPATPRRLGIGCASCHVRGGQILTARPVETDEHPTRVEPLLSSSAFCGSCHQFRFGRRTASGTSLSDNVVQDTWREHQRAGGTERCQDCHMGKRGHRMPGAHDAELLGEALGVRPQRQADGRFSLVLEAAANGHRFPTGDLFRHLRVELWRGDGFASVAELGRSFGAERTAEGTSKRMEEDTSLAPGERRNLAVDGSPGQRWRVVYVYTSERNLGLRPGADAEAVRVLAEGRFE
ncbi:MAG: hypothetical protein U1E65_02875 [Myxococcota bacterium]